jgi:Kef-type K+ transport system membrane component KefB
MFNEYQFLLSLGGILLLGMATDLLGRRTFLPRVTLLLIFGVIIGPEVLDLIPDFFTHRFELIAEMALLMVGFLLGGKLTKETLAQNGRRMLIISITAALTTSLIVLCGLSLLGLGFGLVILLASLAAATAPAAVVDVVMEVEDNSPFANLLLSIVALDDAWALLIFSISLSFVEIVNGSGVSFSPVLNITKELGGALLLGLCIGLPAAYFTGRIKRGQPILTEALGLVFLCGGLALWLEVSFLIASMVMGAVIANLAKHHKYPFHAIEGIEWPIMALFFVLAGATLDIDVLADIGFIGIAYILARTAGKVIGAWLGCIYSNSDKVTRRWLGLAMLPQAGAAIGMALVAANKFPEYHQVLLSIVISTTIIFELFGPVFTRFALSKFRQAQVDYD